MNRRPTPVIPLATLEADLLRRGLDPDFIMAKYSDDQPRVPAGSPDGGQFAPSGEGGGSTEGDESGSIERTATNYRGIKNISFAPSGSDAALIAENKKIVDETLDMLPASAHEGLNALYITNGTFGPMGTASYIAPNARRGYVSDELMTNQPWLEKSAGDRKATLLHEFGHRMQLKTDKKLFSDFKRSISVADHARTLLGQYYKNYPKSAHAGEVFAESFSLFKMGRALAPELYAFWSKANR